MLGKSVLETAVFILRPVGHYFRFVNIGLDLLFTHTNPDSIRKAATGNWNFIIEIEEGGNADSD